MSSEFSLNSDNEFIQGVKHGCQVGIFVLDQEINLQNVSSSTIHSSRWKLSRETSEPGHSLEVHGVKFGGTSSTRYLVTLISDLYLATEDVGRAIKLRVNRNGVCFVNVSENVWVRANDHLFSWAKYGVKVPEPRGSEIWNVLGMVNDDVSGVLDDLDDDVEFSCLRKRAKILVEENEKLKEETVSFLKKSQVKKEKEVASIKVALKALMDK